MINLKSYFAKSSEGPFLKNNEDYAQVDLENKLYMIFDGFGGAGVGDNAVSLICDTITNFYTRIGEDPDSTLPFFYGNQYLLEANALLNAMYLAHDLLKKDNFPKDMSSRGGASAICACQSENILTIASVGNCSALLSRRGEVSEVISPSNFDLITKDGKKHFLSSIPNSAFGLFDDILFTIKEIRISEGDRLIFMTDGANSMISEVEMRHLITSTTDREEFVLELFSLNNSRGNLDNQSTIVLEF